MIVDEAIGILFPQVEVLLGRSSKKKLGSCLKREDVPAYVHSGVHIASGCRRERLLLCRILKNRPEFAACYFVAVVF